MVSMQLATLVVALSGAGDTVLLDFHASWCAPCRSMDGTIAELERAGYPVRKVDTDRERGLAERFRVQTIPCFVLLVDGKEVARVTGATPRSRLLSMFAKAGVQPRGAGGGIARAQSPDHEPAAVPVPAQTTPGPLAMSQPPARDAYDRSQPEQASPQPAATAQALIHASVRLKIEDPRGSSYGSGTIIDCRQGDALVLTCGHIFRDSQGKGRITVDMFDPQAPQQVEGRLVAYDLETDIGLVAIRPGVPVAVAPVAPRNEQIARGDQVVTVGCNNGGPATALDTRITAVDKFLGPPNLQVAGLPVEGRSGGGLFNADGEVIGVCNAADPADNEGLYAALASIHGQLDRAGLTAVYENRAVAAQQALAGAPPLVDRTLAPTQVRGEPSRGIAAANAALDTASDAQRAALGAALAKTQGSGGNAEVICIIRSIGDPQAKSEVIMLDHASAALLQQLAADRDAQAARHLTSLEVPARAAAPTMPVRSPVRFDATPHGLERVRR